jgi:hypothetical protein
MNYALTELGKVDNVTAQIHETMETGESYTGPILIGHYEDSEVWIEREGSRVQISFETLEVVIKQLRRAKKLATPKAHSPKEQP